MNQFSRKVCALLCSAFFTAQVAVADGHVAPFLNFRSPGSNIVHRIEGLNSHRFLNMESFYGTFNATFAYERSFRSKEIARSLFGTSLVDDEQVRITGTAINPAAPTTPVVTRQAGDWMAENFFLPGNFNGSITIKPRVQNFVLGLHFNVGFDEWCPGLYLEIDGAVVHARYDLNVEEQTPTFTAVPGVTGAAGYAAGRFSQNTIAAADLFDRALDFLSGESLAITDLTIQPLRFAKIKTTHDKETSFSDLRVEVGYNFLLEEDYHLGLGVHAVFPTGHRPEGEFLFEAQTSNGKHFKLGGSVSGHYTLWRSSDEEQHLDLSVDATAVHWFNGRETRTFDLKGKAHSRYMLALKMQTIDPEGSLLAGGEVPDPAVQFANEYAPVANFSTREVKVSVGVEVDAAAYLAYICHGFEFDLGYNFWYRSAEKIKLREEQPAFPENTWALKGDSIVYGAPAPVATSFPADAVALSATQSLATIHSGRNILTDTVAVFNTGINTPAAATTTGGVALHFLADDDTLNTSSTPLFITESDLDIDGARTRGMSHKVFTFVGYSWLDQENWIPYLGVGFEAEFGRDDKDSTTDATTTTTTATTSDSSALNIALSKWAVSFKVGVSFD